MDADQAVEQQPLVFEDMHQEIVRQAARAMAAAAITAPKSGGQLFLKGAALFVETVSITEASQTATRAVPGTIQRYDLAKQGSAIVYEITVQPTAGGAPVQVLVDATTGKVLKTQPAPVASSTMI